MLPVFITPRAYLRPPALSINHPQALIALFLSLIIKPAYTHILPLDPALRLPRLAALKSPPRFLRPVRRDLPRSSLRPFLALVCPSPRAEGCGSPMGESLVAEMTAPVGKTEASRDDSVDSIGSSPEPGLVETYAQEEPQQQKRKGGRKPIYATSEERKQRNRQAQAAFRERRTEYIKQLESTIKHHEETLQNLQNSHRNAADECLMLRYKNSLLERVLLEKGIDVQAELHAKTSSPILGPTRASGSTHHSPSQAPLQQRAILNRQQQRRSLQGPPRLDGSNGPSLIQSDGPLQPSPLSQSTPGSHLSSPTQTSIRSPNFMPLAQSVSPNFGPIASQQQPARPQPLKPNFGPTLPGSQRHSLITNQPLPNGISGASTAGNGGSGATQSSGSSSYYQTPFTHHMTQLEQEYEEQADSYDHEEPSDPSTGPGPFPQQNFPSTNNMPPPLTPSQNPSFASATELPRNGARHPYNGLNHQLFDPYDPMLDADPFGLSASMHFPTMYEPR